MWPIYIINLDRAEGRWIRSSEIMRRLGLQHERFPAVDWQRLAADEIERFYCPNPKQTGTFGGLTPPEIACYLSHLKLWEVIAKGNTTGVFVFEDDFDLEPDVPAVMEEISKGEVDWDMLKLYSNRKSRLLDSRPLTGRYWIGMPAVVPMSTIAYAITREAAAGLAEELVPFGRPIDMDLKRWWEHGACIKLVLPSPANYRDAHLTTSEIHIMRQHSKNTQTGLERLWAKLHYQIAFYWRSFLHSPRRRRDRKWG